MPPLRFALGIFAGVAMFVISRISSPDISAPAGRPTGPGSQKASRNRIRLLQNLTPQRNFVGARKRSNSPENGGRVRRNMVSPEGKEEFVRDAVGIFNKGANNFKTSDFLDASKKRHDFLRDITASDFELEFLGTASCIPSASRCVSCTAVKKGGEVWIFDAGEGSQIQVQKSQHIRTSKITKIFITHLHGDHCFGLAGILCLMGAQTDDEKKKNQLVEIFGPKGLRAYLRTALRLTYSRVVPPHVVHELHDIPYLHGPEDTQGLPPFAQNMEGLPRHQRYGENIGGKNIYPDSDGVWTLIDNHRETGLSVKATALRHTVPTVGFALSERDHPGSLNTEYINPIVQRNLDGLREPPFSMRDPKKIFRTMKDMSPLDMFTFPDGTTVRGHEAVNQPEKGRKVVILGDTCDPSGPMDKLARDCDVLIHECTNAYFRELDVGKTPEEIAVDTFDHGHSTPGNAGAYARNVGARRLIMNHFSSRYRGDSAPMSVAIMRTMEAQAALAFDDTNVSTASDGMPKVISAWDLMHIPIPRRRQVDEHVSKQIHAGGPDTDEGPGLGTKRQDRPSDRSEPKVSLQQLVEQEARNQAREGDFDTSSRRGATISQDRKGASEQLGSRVQISLQEVVQREARKKAREGGDLGPRRGGGGTNGMAGGGGGLGIGGGDGVDARRGKLRELKIPELKERLAAAGLPKSGKKDDLITRLVNHELNIR
ncbi:hypothetical protein AAMO2058_001609600 [Amorphochlora amoebiformis]